MKLTKQQKVAVAKRAKALIRKGWVKGYWDKTDTVSGKVSYCLEGACNRAAIEVLGGEEARKLDAAYKKVDGTFEVCHSGYFTQTLSVARTARDYGREKLGIRSRSLQASLVNDAEVTRKKDVVAILDKYIAENS